jgi:hypothetical protein
MVMILTTTAIKFEAIPAHLMTTSFAIANTVVETSFAIIIIGAHL